MAVIGVTASLTVTDGASSAASAIPGIRMMTGPKVDAPKIEALTLDISDGHKKYVPGLRDPGDFSFECEYTAALLVRLHALVNVQKNWVMTGPSSAAGTMSYAGFLTGYEVTFEPESVVAIKATGAVTGAVTVA